MLIIIGLIILVAALIVGVAGVLGNGSTHQAGHEFSVLGYHVTGSSGTIFLAGMVVGTAGLFGLSLLLAGARRTSRRGSAARRSLRKSRRDTVAVSKDRDDLIEQRDTARAASASALGDDAPLGGDDRSAVDDRRRAFQLFGHRFGPRQTTVPQPDPAPDAPPHSSVSIPAGAPASDVAASGSSHAE